MKRFKYLVQRRTERAREGGPYIGLENIESGTGRRIETVAASEGENLAFRPGDVLFGKLRPYLAKAFLADFEGVCTSEFLVLRPSNDITSGFLFYYALSPNFIDVVTSFSSGAKMPRAEWDVIGNLEVDLPPASRQPAIVDFLDRETARIDDLIAKKLLIAELLREEHTALVSNLVRGGLIANAPTRETGIPWIGRVPVSWSLVKLKWVLRTQSGGTPLTDDDSNYGGEVPWLRTLDLNNGEILEPAVRISRKALSEIAGTVLPAGSVLVAMYGGEGTIGKHGLLRFRSAVNQAICAILPGSIVTPEFLHSYMEFYRPYWMVEAQGTRRDPNISQQTVRECPLLIPPIEDQRAIARVLNDHGRANQRSVDLIAGAITLLREYRAALISAAVTGQLDIRRHEKKLEALA
jgi:type I restriction enzyme S subunit